MESIQQELFHEDIYEALSHVVNALGGPKKIGIEKFGQPNIQGVA